MKRSLAALVGIAALVSGLTAADAAPTVSDIVTAASAGAKAEAVLATTDIVSVYNQANALDPDVQARVSAAADSVGGAWALGRSASVGMDRVMRGATVVQQAPSGFHIPMSVSVLPLEAVGALMGRNVASILAQGYIVMGATTAHLRGAQVGDTIDLDAASGAIVTVTIGMVADDAVIGGTEIVMGPLAADAIGLTMVGRIVVWGFPTRSGLDQAFAAYGVERAGVRVRRSWDAADPDGTLSMEQTKVLLGEFSYRVRADGTVDQNPEWPAAFLPPDREVIVPDIPIRVRCNLVIRADLIAALNEVDQAGLASTIDIPNTNAFGGCYYARFTRFSGTLGFLSRHSWGQALDTNTIENPQGGVPTMNCDVVRIFRKHNFAWGGNFLISDGMHFEWVGTRRDQLQYPSAYCPNLPVTPGTAIAPGGRPATIQEANTATQPGRATLFADDGFSNEG